MSGTEQDPAYWLAAGKAFAARGDGMRADQAFEKYFSLAPGAKLVAEGAELQRAALPGQARS